MGKTVSRLLIIFALLAAIGAALYFMLGKDETMFNSGNVLGNSAGNLYNSGIFCENGNKIYFSNFDDSGNLYVMNSDCTDVEKINNDRICFLNSDGNYLYYSRKNNEKPREEQGIFSFYNTGLFRINMDGSDSLCLYRSPVGLLSLAGNYVYYQHYTDEDATTIYKVKIDGSEEVKLSDEPFIPASIKGNDLYFSGIKLSHDIRKMNLTNGSISTAYVGATFLPIATNSWLYFISTLEDYNICRVDYSGKNKETVVDEFCSTYNISSDGKYLFYQSDGGDDNHIGVLNLQSGKETRLLNGNYKWINVTSKYAFFVDYDETEVYAYEYGAGGALNSFNPGKEE